MVDDDQERRREIGTATWQCFLDSWTRLAAPWIGLMFVRRSKEGGTGGKQVMIDGEDPDGQTNDATV